MCPPIAARPGGPPLKNAFSMPNSLKSFGPLLTLSWAVYLGCSWTWCIGMFLPVILVSEFGNIAWFVFAIPNVIGAGAMGWILARPGSSEKIVAEHREACVAFSAVTFAFHLFFLYWLAHIGLMPIALGIIAIAGGVILGFAGRWLSGLDLVAGWLVFGVSLAVLGKGLMHPIFGVTDPLVWDTSGPGREMISPVWELTKAMAGLSPVCVFGFLLCPYLDVTFHRARQKTTPNAGKAAFGIGFGVVFFAMIVLTLMYAGDFARDTSLEDRFGSFGGALLVTWVALHIATQTGFTFATHIRALPRPRMGDLIIWIVAGILLSLTIFAIRQEMWFAVKQLKLAMLSGQLMYELFMSFYGLIFPAYVWICMVPIRGKAPGPTVPALAVFVIAVAIACPMFWMGFIVQQTLWLIPGVLVVVSARWFVREGANVQRPTLNVPLSKEDGYLSSLES
jgi:hypothetical protein